MINHVKCILTSDSIIYDGFCVLKTFPLFLSIIVLSNIDCIMFAVSPCDLKGTKHKNMTGLYEGNRIKNVLNY